MTLKDFSRAQFEQVVRLYLEEAYGDAPVPEAVRQRLDLCLPPPGVAAPAGETLADLGASAAFERTPPDAPPEACERLRLRLGNRAYPHMKLGVDRIPHTETWVLTVDCHDRQLLSVAQEHERAALETFLACNAEFKRRIEKRWAEAGLPTFERYIRARLAEQGGRGAASGG